MPEQARGRASFGCLQLPVMITPACQSSALSATQQIWPPALGDFTCVVAAVHTAADAVTRVVAEDREAVRAAAADHHLYVPAFTRTNATVVRRRYQPACPSRVDEILASYDDALEASTRASSKLGNLALALDAPTWPLAALRAQTQIGLRPFRPGETSISQKVANSPARPAASAPRPRSECSQSPTSARCAHAVLRRRPPTGACRGGAYRLQRLTVAGQWRTSPAARPRALLRPAG